MSLYSINFIISLIIILPVPFIFLSVATKAVRTPLLSHRLWWILVACTGVLSPGFFIATQISLVLKEYHTDIDTMAVISWQLTSYFNSAYYLLSAMLMHCTLKVSIWLSSSVSGVNIETDVLKKYYSK